MALNPFVLRDNEWKEKRIEVAIGMTQNKLKAIFPLIDDVAKKCVNFIKDELNESPKRAFDARDLCVRYTCECVSTCIFAIDGGSFDQKDSVIIKMADKMIRSISGEFLNSKFSLNWTELFRFCKKPSSEKNDARRCPRILRWFDGSSD